MRNFLTMLCALALGVSLVACDGDADTTDATVITAEHDGKTVEARVGETLELRLAANITTPYEWRIDTAPDEAILSQASTTYEADEPMTTGSGGTRIWRYDAKAPGRTTIAMSYASEDGQNVSRRFSVTINVSSA